MAKFLLIEHQDPCESKSAKSGRQCERELGHIVIEPSEDWKAAPNCHWKTIWKDGEIEGAEFWGDKEQA